MGFIARLLDPRPHAAHDESAGPFDDYWYGPVSGPTAAGVHVDPNVAMTVGAVFACTAVLTEDVAGQPCHLMRRIGDGQGAVKATSHPLYSLLHDQPNDDQTAFEYWEMMVGHAVLRGEALARILWRRGYPAQIVPLHPDRAVWERVSGGGLRLRYTREDGERLTLLPDELVRLRGRLGMSVIAQARQEIGRTIATEQFAARSFSQAASPRGVLKHPGKFKDEASAQRIKASWEQMTLGAANQHRTVVLEEGMEWQQVGLSHADAQLLDSQAANVRAVTRWFRMQPHFIGDLEHATFSNIDAQNVEHAQYTIRPWNVRLEQAAQRDLIHDPGHFLKFNMDVLLRGDPLTRAQVLQIQRQNGVINANEWREREDMNPRPGGAAYFEGQQGAASPSPQKTGPAAIAASAAGRVVRKEQAAVRKAAVRLASDAERFREWAEEFFGAHGEYVADQLAIPRAVADRYAADRCRELERAGVRAFEDADGAIEELAALALSCAEEG